MMLLKNGEILLDLQILLKLNNKHQIQSEQNSDKMVQKMLYMEVTVHNLYKDNLVIYLKIHI